MVKRVNEPGGMNAEASVALAPFQDDGGAVVVAKNVNTEPFYNNTFSSPLLICAFALLCASILLLAALAVWFVRKQRATNAIDPASPSPSMAISSQLQDTYDLPKPRLETKAAVRRAPSIASDILRTESAPALVRLTQHGYSTPSQADSAVISRWYRSHTSGVLPSRDGKHAQTRSLGSSVMLVMPPPASSQSLPMMEPILVGLSSHLPGMSLALDTDIDAWRTCKDTTTLLPATVAAEFDKLQASVDTWTKAESPLLDKYLIIPGSMQRPHISQLSATASAKGIQVLPIQDTEVENDVAAHGGAAVDKVEFVVKMFVCAFEQLDREKELWEQEAVAQEMGAIVEFGVDSSSEVSSALQMRAYSRATSAREPSRQLSSDSQALYSQVPCIVMERGMSVVDWIQMQRRSVTETLEMLCAVTESLERVHSMGLTHRNIKPSNLLLLPSREKWTICDFGCSAKTGEKCQLGFTLKYAAPEVIKAYEGNQQMHCTTAAVDIWAVGVIAYELFTHEPVFRPGATDGEVRDALMERSKLPWEDTVRRPLHAPELAAVRPTVLACLERSASERMSAAHVAKGWRAAAAAMK